MKKLFFIAIFTIGFTSTIQAQYECKSNFNGSSNSLQASFNDATMTISFHNNGSFSYTASFVHDGQTYPINFWYMYPPQTTGHNLYYASATDGDNRTYDIVFFVEITSNSANPYRIAEWEVCRE